MGVVLEYAAGATPLDPDEAAGLIPRHITTQKQLNEWELRNILKAEAWVFARKQKNLLSIEFMKKLHERMFDDTWKWAGAIRTTEKNIGAAPEKIAVELRNLCLDVKAQLEHKSWAIDEIAARLHHRLAYVHPFPNGNGRFARIMADLLLVQNGQERFTWGLGDLVGDPEVRRRYISALQKADANDHSLLLGFVRSGR